MEKQVASFLGPSRISKRGTSWVDCIASYGISWPARGLLEMHVFEMEALAVKA